MTLDLEDRLREFYAERTAHLPSTGPGLRDLTARAAPEPVDHSNTRLRVGIALGAAAAIAVLAFAVTNRSERAPNATTPGSAGTSDETTLESPDTSDPVPSNPTPSYPTPVETLPLTNDVSAVPPPTVAGSGPSSWYRLAPDLDIAWYQDGASEPMFCWRTPTIQDCAPDSAPTTARFVSTAGGQELVIVSGDRTHATFSIALDDGSVLTAPIAWDGQIDWGVARFELPVGRAIATDETVNGDIVTVGTPQFLPVVTFADGSAVSPTVPAGSPLTFYQWLPDLAFAERQTADGAGTEFCWRTTAGIGCIPEEFESPAVGIIPTADGAIFLVRPALVTIEPAPTDPGAPTLEVGPNPTIVTVTLSDSSTTLVDVEYEQDFGVGHAQITLPAGVTVTGAASS